MSGVKKRNPGQTEFIQAVQEVAQDIYDFMEDKVQYHEAQILRRIAEPDRIVSFRVCWEDDNNNIRVQRGWRVQNGKGGANCNPKGISDAEVMRFCQSFMSELYRHIGPNTDVPAGDIGVGGREIGYMFGQYKRLTNRWEGVLTGKGQEYGGSQMRPEATGYGAVYFLQTMLKHQGMVVEGHTAVISGSGNVATHAAEKITQLGGKVLTLSDSGGFIHDPDGIYQEKIDFVKHLKTVKRGRISEYADEFKSATFHEGRPWGIAADLALPCATQNELNEDEAKSLVSNGVKGVSEGANMPTTLEGVKVFHDAKIMYGPGKAANAGGVAVSGLEMSQNSERISWNHERLGEMLTDLMEGIHEKCTEYGDQGGGYVDYVKGANIAGFKKVADAIVAQGVE